MADGICFSLMPGLPTCTELRCVPGRVRKKKVRYQGPWNPISDFAPKS
jgi:hypothetical protein